MAKVEISTKRLAISKANAHMVVMLSVASFVAVFCLMASRAVWSQTRYQARVISAKEEAQSQIEANISAYDQLAKSYQRFDREKTNVLGGNRDGSGDNDGSNARIILDSLPGSYDYPALTSSLEKIIRDRGLKVTSISGTDDQANQEGQSASTSPSPVEMPFTFSIGSANYTNVQELISALERSIRPMQIDKLEVSGGANNMSVTVEAHTYFQPGKSLDVTKKVVK